MRKLVTAVLVALQCVTLCLSQQPLPSPPPPQGSKPDNQKPAVPQSPERDDLDVVKITTNLVQIDAVVTDKKGQRITDLKPDEVEMLEDGKSQKVMNFSYVTLEQRRGEIRSQPIDKNAPPTPPVKLRPEQVRRTIALVVDDLGLSFESAYYVRNSLKKFLTNKYNRMILWQSFARVAELERYSSSRRTSGSSMQR